MDLKPADASLAVVERVADGAVSAPASAPPRRRGRPPLMIPETVLREIRAIAGEGRLFRVHFTRSGLYARARRMFGSWEAAVRAAGVDYDQAIRVARQRGVDRRRRIRRARRRSASIR
jgi:hypothetical protein